MVKIEFFDPHPLLASFVQNIFVIDAVISPKEGELIGHYPPTPQHCIFLYLNEPLKAKKAHETIFKDRPRAVVVGPQVTRMELMVNRDHKVAVIGFLPGGLHRLIGVPMVEIFDDGFDGYELLGRDIYDLIDRCSELTSLMAIKDTIESYLLSKLPKVKDLIPLDKALHQLLQSNGNISITQVADNACLSLRQFERKCKERLGFSPKVYARLIRFSNAYRLFEKSENPNWSEIALSSGYYDQMHFIKDFKEFAGISPSMMEEELKRASFRFQKSIRI
jgi:AraC-like DNA-binding protein